MDGLLDGLKAVAEPTRLRLLSLLARAELTVTEITQVLQQSQPRVSRHLKQQRQALPTHRMASSQAFVDACLTGLGWGLNPEALVARHLASGALVELIPDTPLDVALHWQFTPLAAPALAPVTAALRTAAMRWLVPPA